MWTCGIYRQSSLNPNRLVRVWQSEPMSDLPAKGESPPISGRTLAIKAAHNSGHMHLGQKLFMHKGRRD